MACAPNAKALAVVLAESPLHPTIFRKQTNMEMGETTRAKWWRCVEAVS